MIRRAIALFFLIALPAAAQDAPLKVLFRPTHTFAMDDLNQAIETRLSQPPFALVKRPAPDVVIVAIEDPVELTRGKVSGNAYSFKIMFSRDGDPLGESYQSCGAAKLSDCTDQIATDIQTAATPR